MRTLVLSGYGSSLQVNGHTLEVYNGTDGGRKRFPAHQLPFNMVVAEGNSGFLSFEAARFLAIHDVPVVFLRWDGSILSTLLPRGPVAGDLKVAQFAAHVDERKRREIARAILEVKTSKSLELLNFLSRFYPCSPNPVEAEVRRGVPHETIPGLMLWEGRVAAAYWAEFGKVVNRLWPDGGFVSRAGKGKSWAQSATDPVNALLNYGYALLEARVRQAVNSVGLEPAVGFLHEVAPSKFPLVYDLQELFRWVVDLSVVETIAGRQLDRRGDFITTENYHIRLRPSAIGLLAERLTENLHRTILFGGQRRTLDAVLFEAVRTLARYLMGGSKTLDPGYPFVAFDRALTLRAAEEILSLSSAERRALGVRANTFHYLKRRIAEGKPLRLYRKVARRMGPVVLET